VVLQIAVGIGAPAPGEHKGLVLALVALAERGRELGRLDADIEARLLRHRLHHLRDALRIRGRWRHHAHGRIGHARLLEQRARSRQVAFGHRVFLT